MQQLIVGRLLIIVLWEREDRDNYWKGLRKNKEQKMDVEIGEDCFDGNGRDNQRLEMRQHE